MKLIAAVLAGALFGSGLLISGMAQPENVLAFLNIGPGWNVALLFVMGSAVLVNFFGYQLATRRQQPLFDEAFHAPGNRNIDARLIGGAVLFGFGWGIAGYCPGPAIVGAFLIDERALIFLASFVVGVILHRLVPAAPAAPATADG